MPDTSTAARPPRAAARPVAPGARAGHVTPRWWRDASGLAVWASMLVVVALWVAGGGVQRLGSAAGLWTEVGRLSGLVAADLLLIQVLLMARVPMVERSYGQDELARRHRLVGFWSVNLMLLHILTITVGYALSGQVALLSQVWDFVWNYPGMLIATAGSAALVMVAVTSVRAARRKLRFESWHLLHLYAYLGVGLALPHQVWTGHEFIGTPWARLYWWTLYAAAAAAVLVFRVAVPLSRTMTHRVVVDRVVTEGPGVVSLHLRGRRLQEMPVKAGQFFVWRFLGMPGWTRGHPYSLSAAPTGDRLRITVKDLGDGSADIRRIKKGTRVAFEGPYGRLTRDVRTRRKVTMLACGIGITPMRALLEELPYAPGDATLVYRARHSDDLVFRAELDALAARRGITLHYVLGPRLVSRVSWLPHSAGHLREHVALRRLVPDIAEHDVFVCGPDEWMDAVERAAGEAGVPPEHIHVERFSW